MHDIEPFYRWCGEYSAAEDPKSPFYGREYSEFVFSNTVYNYFIHPQWDDFGSKTLYTKILYTDYDKGYTIIECIGEWNDCLYNDIMLFKQGIIEVMEMHGISKFILIMENVLSFHRSDDCYYEEWAEETREEGGWICTVNLLDHVMRDFQDAHLDNYLFMGPELNGIPWRKFRPEYFFERIDEMVHNSRPKMLY